MQVYQLTVNEDRTIFAYIEATDDKEFLKIFNLNNSRIEKVNIEEVVFLGWISRTILIIQTKHELLTYDINTHVKSIKTFLKDKIKTIFTSNIEYFDYVIQLTIDTIEIKRYYFLDGMSDDIMSVNTISSKVHIFNKEKFESCHSKYKKKIFEMLDMDLDSWMDNKLAVSNKNLECSIIINGEIYFKAKGYIDRAYMMDGYVLFSYTNFLKPRLLYKIMLNGLKECFSINSSVEKISSTYFQLDNAKKYKFGDRQVPVVIIEPKEFKFKTVLFLHGGPDTYTRNEYMNFIYPMLKNGVRIMLVDYSGSISYGSEFYQRILKDNGEEALKDIESILMKITDGKTKIFVTGESFGGYLAILSAIKFSGIINKVISINGFTDYRYQYIFSVARQIVKKYFDINISKNNPIDLLDKVSGISPLVLIHGVRDLYCPIKQMEVFMEKSKLLGYTDIKLIRIEGAEHYSMLPQVMEKFYFYLVDEVV